MSDWDVVALDCKYFAVPNHHHRTVCAGEISIPRHLIIYEQRHVHTVGALFAFLVETEGRRNLVFKVREDFVGHQFVFAVLQEQLRQKRNAHTCQHCARHAVSCAVAEAGNDCVANLASEIEVAAYDVFGIIDNAKILEHIRLRLNGLQHCALESACVCDARSELVVGFLNFLFLSGEVFVDGGEFLVEHEDVFMLCGDFLFLLLERFVLHHHFLAALMQFCVEGYKAVFLYEKFLHHLRNHTKLVGFLFEREYLVGLAGVKTFGDIFERTGDFDCCVPHYGYYYQ